MGKGSLLKDDRRMYNFSLNEKDPDDMKLIKFLELRSTTNCVREGLRLVMNSIDSNSQQQGIDLLKLIINNSAPAQQGTLIKNSSPEPQQDSNSVLFELIGGDPNLDYLRENIGEILNKILQSTNYTKERFIEDVLKMRTYEFYENPVDLVAKLEYLKSYDSDEPSLKDFHPPYQYHSSMIMLSNGLIFEYWEDKFKLDFRDNRGEPNE